MTADEAAQQTASELGRSPREKGTKRLAEALTSPNGSAPGVSPGKWSAKRIKATAISIHPKDRGTLHLVTYSSGGLIGDIAVVLGENAANNAALFTAAPDLLAALQDLQCVASAVLSANGAVNEDGAEWTRRALAHNLGILAKERDAARAAIAKAEGRV